MRRSILRLAALAAAPLAAIARLIPTAPLPAIARLIPTAPLPAIARLIPTALLVPAALLISAAPAVALPGDPPITALAPADGARVRAARDGIAVAFSCSAYRKDVYGDSENPIVDYGSADDYDVIFSPVPDLDARGTLANAYPSSEPIVAAADGSCTTELDTQDSATSPELVGGTVYWQAYRRCVGCQPTQLETGPVRSFVVQAEPIASTVAPPRRVYAGYLTQIAVRARAEVNGAQVTLQRQAGRRWIALGTEQYAKTTDFYVRLPEGSQRLRAVVTTGGSSSPSPVRRVAVRPDRGRTTSARDDGSYAAPRGRRSGKLELQVAGGGRTLRGFSASVTAYCFGATVEDNRFLILFAGLDATPIAPDGSVTGRLQTKSRGAEVTLTGRVRDGRFSGETSIFIASSRCSGTRDVVAVKG